MLDSAIRGRFEQPALAVAAAAAAVPRLPLVAPLRVPSFALLWAGNAISLAGAYSLSQRAFRDAG